MRILFVADGRSPIALNWIEHFAKGKYEVHLVSTFACQPDIKLAPLHFVPVAFSATAGARTRAGRGLRSLLSTGLRTRLRSLAGPLTLGPATNPLKNLILEVKPHVVHALRIP